MNSNSNYSQFIEHSFRRLTLLIHQQDDLDTSNSTSTNKTTEQSSSSSLINHQKNNMNKNEFSSKKRSMNDNESIDTMIKVEPMLKTHRTYMRPPKNRTTVSYRCSSSQLSDRSETSFEQPLNTSCLLPVTKQKSNELPIHIPYERTLYDVKFERDRQNDIREKYNIPLPFQRKWLRQPRYVPQERPNIGQIKKSDNP